MEERVQSLGYEAYTIGIVCALEFEMSAVRYMLDKEHARLPRKLGDSSLYVLGELSGHNVVLASLPGSQGKGAAAAVAKDMARTFPSIELRLMVGIGGGVPSGKNDIRLGDVVVSVPDGEHGGVVQYDLGKNTDDGFVMKGFLWPPPEILRSAVGIMRSDHRVSQNKIPEFLSAMFQKSDDLRVSYQRPVEPDELFQLEYRHVPNQATCQLCDKTKRVQRLLREPTPKIHYGLIASGDQVMRSAPNTAEMDGRVVGDVLCFEMEAAGMATQYSCIAVRGVSDYADSHKNDAWQHYAAAAAAGCAKELLSYVDLLQPSTTTAAVGQHGFDSSMGNRPAAQHIFRGQGVQNSGSGNVSIGKDLNIGRIDSW
ncbi:nucleoside phosphorylase domain-containing protein [Lasiosphaeria miniovina]|uniref:Nucleoside phosphorylase domain-containing protein n=1 Tax=Lasiosphaeria miniovina TaxID=1954250 RepID=A0AA40DXT6_9PEZI|nr:nucleoside phosphorylase domain-containing protein [Lasiosphaeria miniovina]KAK0717607.1 nucleoside phosphorylase domain-containing protein [Lasiosphaeria miniovina]